MLKAANDDDGNDDDDNDDNDSNDDDDNDDVSVFAKMTVHAYSAHCALEASPLALADHHHTSASASYISIIFQHYHHTSAPYIIIIHQHHADHHHTSASAPYINSIIHQYQHHILISLMLDFEFWMLISEFWSFDHQLVTINFADYTGTREVGSPHIHTGYCFISLLLSIPTTIRLRTKIIFSIAAIR